MANKRELKKFIRRMCGAVAGESILAAETIHGADVQKLGEAIVETADLQEASLALVSLGFDKCPKDFDNRAEYAKARREYYKKSFTKLITDFENHLNTVVSKMNEALPK